MKILTKEQQKSYENAKLCYIYQENLENKYVKDKKYFKVRDHCHYAGEYRGATQNIFNLKYCVPKKILIAFRNGSNYDYQFIIKGLVEKFEKRFTCLGENTEKKKQNIIFTVPIKKEVTRTDKNGEEITKNLSY